MENGGKRRSSDWHIQGWAAILLAPILIPIAIIAGFFSKPIQRTPAEVEGFIRDFIEGTGGEWDWDDFTSVSIANPELESIRQDADLIVLPVTPEGEEELRRLLARAGKIKTAWLDAGQPG